MNQIKRFLIFFFTIIIFISCGQEKKSDSVKKQNSKYGGVLKFNCEFTASNFFPLMIGESVSYRIGSQIFEGLVKLDPESLLVQPSLAESWTVDSNAQVFTFKIRKGVYFHDDACFPNAKGREVTAHDIKFCLDKICERAPYNQMFWLVQDKIKGAEDYYKQTAKGQYPENGVEGVKVIDDYTVRIELSKPFAIFPKVLTHSAFWIYPKEALEKYGKDIGEHPVGTGAFYLKKLNPNETVFLAANPSYWRKDAEGNKLPYLDGVKFMFILDNDISFLEFRKKKIDVLYFYSAHRKQVEQDLEQHLYKLTTNSSLATAFMGFNCQKYPFNNKLVRLAFAYGVNYAKMGNNKTKREVNGFVAPIENYPYFKTSPIPYNPQKAKELLAQAGFDKINKFPKIKFTITSDYTDEFEIMQKYLYDNLGKEMDVEILPMEVALEKYESGDFSVFFSSWFADYPDPENFLNLLYGKNLPENPNDYSYINWFRYKNEKFDSLFDKALVIIDEEERNEIFQQADQIAINDAAVIPIHYMYYAILNQNHVKNIHYNSIHYYDFSEVYFQYDDTNNNQKNE